MWVRDGSVVLRCRPGRYVDEDAMIETLRVEVYGSLGAGCESRAITLPNREVATLSFVEEAEGRVTGRLARADGSTLAIECRRRVPEDAHHINP